MLTNHLFLTGRHLPFLGTSDAGGGGGGEPEDPVDPAILASLNANGQEALRRLAAQRDAERTKNSTMQSELDSLKQWKADQETAAQTARDQAARDQGKFEELAQDLTVERDALKVEVESLKGTISSLKSTINTLVEAEWKELPDEVKDLYIGDPDDPVVKLKFIPKGKAHAAKIAGTTNADGTARLPKPDGATNVLPTREQVLEEMRRNAGLAPRG